MPTHVEMAVRLLSEAATFFRTVGEQNPALKEQMDQNANIYEQTAGLLQQDPNGEIDIAEEGDGGNDEPPPAAA